MRPSLRQSPWLVSGLLHGLLAAVLLVLFLRPIHQIEKVEITVDIVNAAPVAAKPVNISTQPPKTKPLEKKAPRAVFGMSRKSITSDAPGSEEVKAGNTLTKTPDQEKLRPGDPDQLPVPTEEYLVTRMPELAQEVRVPYPAEAKRKGAQGSVVMDILIDAAGRVRDAKLVQGPEESLNQAALQAVHGFVFKPALIQDRAVAVRIRYAYRFVLER